MPKPPIALSTRASSLALRETDLPEGVIGCVEGIALVYDIEDTFGTTFAPGCLDRTRNEKVAAGKVRLFWDHGNAPLTGFYDSDLHIGTVRSLADITMPDGRRAAYMVAELIDNPKAREVKQYLRGVLGSGGTTGLSVGFISRNPAPNTKERRGMVYREIELREISITSIQSVPDSEVVAVRANVDSRDALRAALLALIMSLGPDVVQAMLDGYTQGNADAEDSDATGLTPDDSDAQAEDSRSAAPQGEPEFATMEERLFALRRTYA